MEQGLQSAGFLESLAVLIWPCETHQQDQRIIKNIFVWLLMLWKVYLDPKATCPPCLKAQPFLRKICSQFHPADDVGITVVAGCPPQARRARLRRGCTGAHPSLFLCGQDSVSLQAEIIRWVMKNSLLGSVNLSCRFHLVSQRTFLLPAGESFQCQCQEILVVTDCPPQVIFCSSQLFVMNYCHHSHRMSEAQMSFLFLLLTFRMSVYFVFL